MAARIVVGIDTDLRDLFPGFLVRKAADARTILASIGRGDWELIAATAHKLKGEGGSYGLDRITDLGLALEEAAKQKDQAATRLLADELASYLAQVEVVYEPSKS